MSFVASDCTVCGTPRKPRKGGRGMCQRCYNDWYHASNPEQRPRAWARWQEAHGAERTAKNRALHGTQPRQASTPERRREQSKASKIRHATAVHEGKRRRYFANRATHLVKNAAYRTAHRQELNAYFTAYRDANRDLLKAKRDAAYAADPERIRERSHRKNARRTAAFVAPVLFAAIWQRDMGVCQICRKPVARPEASLDHILPIACGGTHEPRNVRITHRICNCRRQHRGAAQLRLID